MDFKIKNFSIREFNNDVNNSGDLNYKYKKWAVYRRNIKQFISSTIEQKTEPRSIIVFGVGECNDLDLHYLAKTFERVVLTDVAEKSINSGLQRQQLNNEEIDKIEIMQVEYTGLENAGFFKTLSLLAGSGAQIGRASCRERV